VQPCPELRIWRRPSQAASFLQIDQYLYVTDDHTSPPIAFMWLQHVWQCPTRCYRLWKSYRNYPGSSEAASSSNTLKSSRTSSQEHVRATDKLKVHFVEPMTYEMTPELLRVVRSNNSRPFNYFYARKPQHDQQHSWQYVPGSYGWTQESRIMLGSVTPPFCSRVLCKGLM